MTNNSKRYKSGFRTCYNCYSFENCKLLKLHGVTPANMFNCCPDIKMKEKPKRVMK